ncbi:MAG TPA: hypothetical protein VIM62_01490 [Acidobacteriaceae bacterium]
MQTAIQTIQRFLHSLAMMILLCSATMLHATDERSFTVVFFADHPIADQQWSSLFAQIHLQQIALTASSDSSSEEPHINFLRGDQVLPGLVVDNAISVYLHGDCSQIPSDNSHLHLSASHPEALGWVEHIHGRITPFIHIECAAIAKLLRSSSLFLSADRGDLTSIAAARVFLHEWLHIEKQSAHHAHTGIAKSVFTANDLIGSEQTAQLHKQMHAEGPILLSPAHGK